MHAGIKGGCNNIRMHWEMHQLMATELHRQSGNLNEYLSPVRPFQLCDQSAIHYWPEPLTAPVGRM